MLPFLLLFLLLGCKKNLSAEVNQTDSLNLTGQTGRNLTIEVNGLRTSKSKSSKHTVCAIGLAGNEVLSKEIVKDKLFCATGLDQNSKISVRLKDLPYPSYVTLFHDENNNKILDFAVLDLVVLKQKGPAEGVGVLDMEDKTMKFSRPIWVEVGEQKTQATLTYEDMPFWKVVKSESWQMFFNWYNETAFKVNHPNQKKSPFPEFQPDP